MDFCNLLLIYIFFLAILQTLKTFKSAYISPYYCSKRFVMLNQTMAIMGWESSDVSFNLGPLFQGQTRTAKLKSAYNSLIIGPRGLQCETKL